MEFYQIYFKLRPTKKYYIACEIANTAYKHEIIPNEFEDDDSVNHKVTFSEEQVKDMDLLLNRCIGNGGIFEGIIGFDIFGVDIRYVEGWSDFEYNPTEEQPPLTGGRKDFIFLNNSTGLNKDENINKVSKEVIKILMGRLNLNNEKELSQYLRKKYMIPMQEQFEKAYDKISEWRETNLYKDISPDNYEERKIIRKKHNQSLKGKIETVYYNRLVASNQVPVR